MNTLKTYPQIQAIPKTQESYAEMMRNSCDIETRSNSVTNPDNYIKPTGTVAMFSKVHHNIMTKYPQIQAINIEKTFVQNGFWATMKARQQIQNVCDLKDKVTIFGKTFHNPQRSTNASRDDMHYDHHLSPAYCHLSSNIHYKG